jgi:penicillin-binding protein 2
MVPRRNPEFAIVVLQEHGDWGAHSALVAAKVVNAFVTKQRRKEHNLGAGSADPEKPVEVGAVWSNSLPGKKASAASFHAGHFYVKPESAPRSLASSLLRTPLPLPIWQPIRFREEHR